MKIRFVLVAMALAVTPLLADATPDGASVFKSKCAICHGPDGAGQTPLGKSLKIKVLASPEVQKQTDAQLAGSVSNGKGKMPPYKGKLSAEEIRAVVKHIRTLKK